MKIQTLVAAVALTLIASSALTNAGKPEQPLTGGEHYIELNGVRFWYDVIGTGRPVLVIQAPGWGIGSSYLQNGLAPLAKHFSLVFYDTRGSGRSSRPATESDMSTSDMVDDLERLRKYWGLHSMEVLGHSHGGEIALDYAVRYPGEVRRLVLVDSCLSGYDDAADMKSQIESRKNDNRFTDAIAEANSDKEPNTHAEFAASLHRMLPLYFYDPVRNMPIFEKTATTPPSAWVEHALTISDKKHPFGVADKLDRVRAKTLVLVGHDDWVCPIAVAERIHAGTKRSSLVIFPKTGHFPWIESPENFFNSVVQFETD